MHYDIAIIGYGPVGAMAANMFGSSGLNIVVIEPKKEIWDIPRAVALDGQAQRIFQLPLSKFKILIHPKSYLHSIVKFHDGTSKLLIHDTSMVIPIFNSLFNDDSTKKFKRTIIRNIRCFSFVFNIFTR